MLADLPKGLAVVSGRPILSYLLDFLIQSGISRVVLCTGYLGDQVAAAFGDRHGELKLAYSREISPLGTAGALVHAAPLFRTEDVLVLNGDSYCEFDFSSFRESHEAQSALATILLTHVADARRFGAIRTDAESRVVAWTEKGEEVPSKVGAWINAGVYLLKTSVLRSAEVHKMRSLERELFPSLIGSGLYAFHGGGRFIDIGTPESLAKAESFFDVSRGSKPG